MKRISKLIEEFLNKRGYYKSDMPHGSAVTEPEILEMFGTYGENEMFVRLLRDLCARDIRLYFQASNDKEREMIRGAHLRTNYFISLIKKSNDRKNKLR
jgi:RNA recognition motif-containing protein